MEAARKISTMLRSLGGVCGSRVGGGAGGVVHLIGTGLKKSICFSSITDNRESHNLVSRSDRIVRKSNSSFGEQRLEIGRKRKRIDSDRFASAACDTVGHLGCGRGGVGYWAVANHLAGCC